MPAACKDYLNPNSFKTVADVSRFDSNKGAAILIGGDECLVWITTSVSIAYHAILLYA